MIFLAADIGGSNARLLLGRSSAAGWEVLRQTVLPSRHYAGIEALLDDFLLANDRPAVACLALAGPSEAEQVRLTNLPWQVDTATLGARFGMTRLRLINDFAAQAHGLARLDPADLHTLQHGKADPQGMRALIGAGTGLGMALLLPDTHGDRVLPSEGGHVDFAPRDAQQRELLEVLAREHGRVSLETLLSGAGLQRLYAFIAGLPHRPPHGSPDAAAITAAALAGDAQAAGAVDLFARLLAAAAGNLALGGLCRGGVYLSGGIAPKILPFLNQPAVRSAFCDKAPMTRLLADIPLHVVLNEQLGLLGATAQAARLARTLT